MPLDYTIEVILRFIYTEREIETNITKKELEYLLILCTKNAHFSFNGQLYIQKDGGSYGLPMRTRYSRYVHGRIRKKFTTNVISVDDNWKRYVGDTISYVKVDCIENIQKTLNYFHANISFTYEQECDSMISFLDVLIMRKNNTIETTVYRKQTHNDFYLHWDSFTSEAWKRENFLV